MFEAGKEDAMTSNAIDRKWPDILGQLYLDHPDWNATQFRRQLLIILGEIKTPGPSAVQKRLQRMRDNDEESSGLDVPWHIHDGLDMPAEAIGRIMEVKDLIQQLTGQVVPLALTIREARWVAKLYAVKSLSEVKTLWLVSLAYAVSERLSDVSDVTFDTSELDGILIQPDIRIVKELASYMDRHQIMTKLMEALDASEMEGDEK
jgi:hypothetical protein